jgi:hypothetical protein
VRGAGTGEDGKRSRSAAKSRSHELIWIVDWYRPYEEAELERRLVDSLEEEQLAKLIPWEALFPRQRASGTRSAR